jgi:mono/diheme cytochrome c family protein
MKTISVLFVTLSVVAIAGAREELRSSTVAVASIARQEPDGRLLYLKNCRTCHGATGLPSDENKEKYPKIKALNDAAFLGTLSDDSILTVLKKGKGKDMKAWNEKLNPAEMVSVVKYVRTLPTKKS